MFVNIDGLNIYYETLGGGEPFILLMDGVLIRGSMRPYFKIPTEDNECKSGCVGLSWIWYERHAEYRMELLVIMSCL